jgi:hypothetical protein
VSEPETNTPEIVPGSRRARLMLIGELLLVGAGLVAALLVLWHEHQQVQRALSEENAALLHLAVERMLWLAAVCHSLLGIFLVRVAAEAGLIAWRTERSGRFPPPGMRVGWDTPIRRGPAARRAAIARAFAAAGCLFGVVGIWYMHHSMVHGWNMILEMAAGFR